MAPTPTPPQRGGAYSHFRSPPAFAGAGSELVEACPERLQGSRRGPLFLLAVQEERTGLRQAQHERIIFDLPSELLRDADPDDARVEGAAVGRRTRVIRGQDRERVV